MKTSSIEAFDMALAFQRGEEKGFNYFFNLLYKGLVYYSFRITDNWSVCEEIVSDSFVKIWHNRSTFDHPIVIRTWLFTTVRNGSLSHLHNQKPIQRLHKKMMEADEEYEEPVEHKIIRAEILAQEIELQNRLIKKLDILASECQKIMKLLYIEGLTTRQVADMLGLSLSTVKNQKANGLQLLNKIVNHKEGEALPALIVNREIKNGDRPRKLGVREQYVQDLKRNKVAEWSRMYEIYRTWFYAAFKAAREIPTWKRHEIVFDAIEEVRRDRMNYNSIAEYKFEIKKLVQERASRRFQVQIRNI